MPFFGTKCKPFQPTPRIDHSKRDLCYTSTYKIADSCYTHKWYQKKNNKRRTEVPLIDVLYYCIHTICWRGTNPRARWQDSAWVATLTYRTIHASIDGSTPSQSTTERQAAGEAVVISGGAACLHELSRVGLHALRAARRRRRLARKFDRALTRGRDRCAWSRRRRRWRRRQTGLAHGVACEE